jgi:integrase
MQALTEEQALQFLEAAQGDSLEALYVLALTTGMRQGELLGLKWDDLDLTRGTVQIRRTITRLVGEGIYCLGTKDRKESTKNSCHPACYWGAQTSPYAPK